MLRKCNSATLSYQTCLSYDMYDGPRGQIFAAAGALQVLWIGLKRRSTQGNDVTITFAYVFKDGCITNSLRKIRPSYW